ncbi:minor tail protein [Rhodococcus phage Trogglehumper]|uniref:Minor tail protein n=1 Tax=Rhodococcus phage Trogglehumper TaxID=3038381 RepID=A0AAF0GNM1_9CAUD|nr:minor tail protein [Rhodococcus phage Trogglehumper]
MIILRPPSPLGLQVSNYADSFLSGTSATTLAVNLPAANIGDLMVMVVETNLYYATAVPTGWELAGSDAQFTTNRISIYVFQRIKDGTEGSTVTFGPTNSACAIAARVLVIPGADKILNWKSTFSVSSVSTVPTPALGVTVPGALFVRALALYKTSNVPAGSGPTYDADMNPMLDVHSNTSFFTTLGMATKLIPQPAVQPLSNHTINPTSRYATMSFEIVPKVPKTLVNTQRVKLSATTQTTPGVENQLLNWDPTDANAVGGVQGLVVQGDGPATLSGNVARPGFNGNWTATYKVDGAEFFSMTASSFGAALPAGLKFYFRQGQVISMYFNAVSTGSNAQVDASTWMALTPA